MRTQSSFSRFRKSTKLKVDPLNIIGWSKLVEHLASFTSVQAFNYKCQDELMLRLKTVFKENRNTLKSTQK